MLTIKKIRRNMKYRKSVDMNKRCENCIHLKYIDAYGYIYYKCVYLGINSSANTNVRLRDICDFWEKEVIKL